MSSRDTMTQTKRRERKADILFWLFVVIFSTTVVFSFLALAIIFGWLRGPEPALRATFNKFAWALWSFVLLQVVGVIALYKDLFGLSSKGELYNCANKFTEIQDGFEKNDMIPKETAYSLRELMSEMLSNMPEGVAGTALGKLK